MRFLALCLVVFAGRAALPAKPDLSSVAVPSSTPPFTAKGDSKYLVTDVKAKRPATYVILAADPLAEDCDALLAHRERRGQTVALVRASDVFRAYGSGKPSADAVASFLKHAGAEWGLRFALVVGDVEAIPVHVRDSAYQTEKWANDPVLATDQLLAPPGVALGRFPADTPGELAVMIAKTIEYETAAAPGPWQRRISFITGEAGFGTIVDSFIEAQFTKIVTDMIPAPYDIEIAYAKPSSPYSPHPSRFNDNAIRMLNDGSLFYVYVGHGHRTGCDDIKHKGESYPILDASDAARVRVDAGRPIMVVIACNTGEFDSDEGDCLGETLFKSAAGPVAFIGGTRVTQPYANALLGRALVDATLRAKPTVGEALLDARARVLAEEDSDFRRTADRVAGAIMGGDALEPMRQDVVMHYNLLGDPALALRRPADGATVEVERDGRRVIVRGRAPVREGRAIVTFDVARNQFVSPPAKIRGAQADDPERYLARYRASNDKSLARAEVVVKEGVFEAAFALGSDLAEGKYYARAFVWSPTEAVHGAAEVVVE